MNPLLLPDGWPQSPLNFELVPPACGTVWVDLSQICRFDLEELEALTRLRDQLAHRGQKLVLVRVPGHILLLLLRLGVAGGFCIRARRLKRAGKGRILPVARKVASAEAAFPAN